MQRKNLPLAAALSGVMLSLGALAGCSSPTPPANGDAAKSAATAAAPAAAKAVPANPCAPQAAAAKAGAKGAPANPCAPAPGRS